MESLDRQCEKFMGGPTQAYSERVHVTLNQQGTIFLNQKALRMLGGARAVYLYFNRQKDMIIIEPTSALTSNCAFVLKDNAQVSGRYLRANPFCKHFGIRLDSTRRFIDPTTDSAGRLYLKLSETVSVALGKKRIRRKRE